MPFCLFCHEVAQVVYLLGEIYTFSREPTLLELFCIPSEKGSTGKGKNRLTFETFFFVLK